jgi:hypothetical protein
MAMAGTSGEAQPVMDLDNSTSGRPKRTRTITQVIESEDLQESDTPTKKREDSSGGKRGGTNRGGGTSGGRGAGAGTATGRGRGGGRGRVRGR